MSQTGCAGFAVSATPDLLFPLSAAGALTGGFHPVPPLPLPAVSTQCRRCPHRQFPPSAAGALTGGKL